jgi:DNA-binding transcriptional MerR regulator
MGDREYDLKELSAAADMTPRTIRYYITRGLLPGPLATGPGKKKTGPGKKYGSGHLERLRLIKKLKDEKNQPLSAIREALEQLDDEIVSATLARMDDVAATESVSYTNAQMVEPATDESVLSSLSSASDYIRDTLHGANRPSGHRGITSAQMVGAPHPTSPTTDNSFKRWASGSGPHSSGTWGSRSQWDRFSLTPNIELHVRRPLTQREHHALKKLNGYIEDLFGEETS